jgi:CRISPR-associated endonuclease/helicase Cas3
MGDRLPADHNYLLYSALIEKLPELKGCDWQLKTINGIPDSHGWIKLGNKSWLGIRCDLEMLEAFGALDNQVLRVGSGFMEIGLLEGQGLTPKPNLCSRLVTFKSPTGCFGEYEFGVSLGRVLNKIGLQKPPQLGNRGTLKIKKVTVAGYSLRFENLPAEYSLWLQRYGIGGRRKMGCGVFE